MLIRCVTTALTALLFGFPLAADETAHRQLGAHTHGTGSLNIAIEGGKVEIEFEAPGADIAGFEHAAGTSGQKAAVEKAKTTLSEALALFKLPGDAGCKVDKADVEVRNEEHHHGDESTDAGAKTDDDGDHDGHSEFHALYAFSCAKPAAITSLETTYFKAFAGAKVLNVNVVTSKGQSQMQLTREQPVLALTGLM